MPRVRLTRTSSRLNLPRGKLKMPKGRLTAARLRPSFQGEKGQHKVPDFRRTALAGGALVFLADVGEAGIVGGPTAQHLLQLRLVEQEDRLFAQLEALLLSRL